MNAFMGMIYVHMVSLLVTVRPRSDDQRTILGLSRTSATVDKH